MAKTTKTVTEESNDMPVLAYRVGELEKAVSTGFTEVKAELHELRQHYATKADISMVEETNKAKNDEQDKAIEKLEDWNIWATRIVLGAVILAVLSIVVAKTNNLL